MLETAPMENPFFITRKKDSELLQSLKASLNMIDDIGWNSSFTVSSERTISRFFIHLFKDSGKRFLVEVFSRSGRGDSEKRFFVFSKIEISKYAFRKDRYEEIHTDFNFENGIIKLLEIITTEMK